MQNTFSDYIRKSKTELIEFIIVLDAMHGDTTLLSNRF
jgi:hypothetical protein